MKTALLLDTETDSPEPTTCKLIEIGWVHYSLEHACILSCYSTVVRAETNAAEELNGIPAAILPTAVSRDWALGKLEQRASTVDVVIAHNASFDRTVLSTAGCVFDKPWICSMDDIVWPKTSTKSLTAIALAHGVGVVHAHRALPDCLTLAAVLTRCKELGCDLVEMMHTAMRPKVKVIALVSYAQKDLAKRAGFAWDGATKVWWKAMVESDVVGLPFKCRIEQPKEK